MVIGNIPKDRREAVEGKRYWELSIGELVTGGRFFTEGWRAFEFIIFKPYQEVPVGLSQPHTFRLAFAYWLPFYSI